MNAARLAVYIARKTTANKAQTEAINLNKNPGNPDFGINSGNMLTKLNPLDLNRRGAQKKGFIFVYVVQLVLRISLKELSLCHKLKIIIHVYVQPIEVLEI